MPAQSLVSGTMGGAVRGVLQLPAKGLIHSLGQIQVGPHSLLVLAQRAWASIHKTDARSESALQIH